MEKLTKQQYLDLLVTTSKQGGFPAVSEREECAYRSDDGKRCAVGLILPDAFYDSHNLEGSTVVDIADEFPEVEEFFPAGLAVKDMREIQNCHDTIAQGIDYRINRVWSHDRFVYELLGCACFYGMKPTV